MTDDTEKNMTRASGCILRFYCRRWGRHDVYRIKKTKNGWYVAHIMINGDCDPNGDPYLFNNLNHDSVNYPADLGGYMRHLWKEANAGGWDEKKIQPKLNLIGKWISKTEMATPKGVFEDYK